MMLVGLAVAPGDALAAEPELLLDHRRQTGLSLMPGTGYRVIVPYKDDEYCGGNANNDNQRVCTNQVPWFLDLQLSFGATRRLDVVVDLRFGLGEDPASQSHQFALAPGIRVWLDPDAELKYFTTVQAHYDSTDYRGKVPSNDFGVRNSNGLMYDPIRNLGFYVQFGESIGFRRWFRIEMDVGLGVQVRFP
jgi:hypothetical protein